MTFIMTEDSAPCDWCHAWEEAAYFIGGNQALCADCHREYEAYCKELEKEYEQQPETPQPETGRQAVSGQSPVLHGPQ